MKKIFWTSVFWIVLVIVFWAYVRLFNQDLGVKLSYCFMGTPEVVTQTGALDYSNDITMINQQLLDIKDKVENILQTLGASDALVAPNAVEPYNTVTPLINTQIQQ